MDYFEMLRRENPNQDRLSQPE